MTGRECIEFAKECGCRFVDLRFTDLPGVWQHFTVPVAELNERSFEDGFGFDGSSIKGFQAINLSDMLVVPDPFTRALDPFAESETLVLVCNVLDPVTRLPYTRDPRFVARKATEYLRAVGVADSFFVGPEAEFFVFDDVRYDVGRNFAFHVVDSEEAQWNTGRDEGPNLGYKVRHKQGYFPVPPCDTLWGFRSKVADMLASVGIGVEAHHHEVATAGQCEIDIRFAPLLEAADRLMWFKYIVKNMARREGKTATFMPKPVFEDNGSGMHCHVSLWKDGQNLFSGNMYGSLSPLALHFIGGIIEHAGALCAFTNPTTNSYRRLVPGFEAPINLAYSTRNRSAAIRIPVYSDEEQSRRIEVRFPDPSCNPYLAFAAILMAGLDGVRREIEPGPPLDKDIYGLSPEQLKDVPTTPASLHDALDALEMDHDFLLAGDVFTEDLLDHWIHYKREQEAKQVDARPHPYEYMLYFDV